MSAAPRLRTWSTWAVRSPPIGAPKRRRSRSTAKAIAATGAHRWDGAPLWNSCWLISVFEGKKRALGSVNGCLMDREFPVVTIGASVGGLGAVRTIIEAIPSRCDGAVALVIDIGRYRTY